MIVKRQKLFFGFVGIDDEKDERFKPYVTEEWKRKTNDQKMKDYCTLNSPRMLYYKDHPEEYKKQLYLKEHNCHNEISKERRERSAILSDLYYNLKYDHEHKKD